MSKLDSRQTNWSVVHAYVEAILKRRNVNRDSLPSAGSPSWCAMHDGDVRKLAAVLIGGEHWALHVEGCQRAMAEAASDISASRDDWAKVASEMRSREAFRADRPCTKRVSR